MSANLVVDLGNTCLMDNTLPPNTGSVGSGGVVDAFRSGIMIGASVDMLHADTFCNLLVQGYCATSGPLVLQVQTSDTDVSGNYTDPTSGVSQFPTTFQSGGLLYIGLSGNTQPGIFNSGFVSGQAILSGFACAAAFQRLGRFARVNMLSGFYAGPLQVTFISNYKTTGSGGGFSYSPGSGTINV
jgi:hypothetical protein